MSGDRVAGFRYLLHTGGQEIVVPTPRSSPEIPGPGRSYPDGLDEAMRAYKNGLKPDETVRTYDNGLRAWQTFCDATGLPGDVVREGALTTFVEWRWAQGRAPNTIRTNLTGMAVRLRERGVRVAAADIAGAKEHVERLAARAAAAGEVDRGRGRAPALAIAALRDIVAQLDTATAAGARDRVVFCLGFALAARSHEMAFLRVGDITETEEGLRVAVRVSKTGRRTVLVAYGSNPSTCPVRAWVAWRRMTGFSRMLDGTEAVVQRIHRSGALHGQMSAKSVRTIVRARAAAAGYEVVTSHSIRAGLITAARKAGKDVKAIIDVSGHSAKSGQVYEYFRDPDGWAPENNATMGIGL